MDADSAIFTIIKEAFNKAKKTSIKYSQIIEAVKEKEFSLENLKHCIDKYASISVLELHEDIDELQFNGKF